MHFPGQESDHLTLFVNLYLGSTKSSSHSLGSSCLEHTSLLLLPPSETAQLVGSATVSRNLKILFQMFPFQMFDCPEKSKTGSFKSQMVGWSFLFCILELENYIPPDFKQMCLSNLGYVRINTVYPNLIWNSLILIIMRCIYLYIKFVCTCTYIHTKKNCNKLTYICIYPIVKFLHFLQLHSCRDVHTVGIYF